MPFTFSHPAIVLPFCLLKRKIFSVTGLIIGSIVPDVEYFFMAKKKISYISHTLPGAFVFNLPLGLLLFILFHALVRKPLVQHLPLSLYQRFAAYKTIEWKSYLKRRYLFILFSLILGTATHLAWDKLVHIIGDYLYFHQHRIFYFDSWKHHTFIYLLTHTIHSLTGLMFVALAIYKLPVTENAHKNPNIFAYWLLLALITIVLSVLRVLVVKQYDINAMAVSVLFAFFVGLVVSSVVFKPKV